MTLSDTARPARVAARAASAWKLSMQAATSGDTEREPILLWVEGDVGHGRGKPLALRQRDAADLMGFFGWQLGLDWAGESETAAAAPASPN